MDTDDTILVGNQRLQSELREVLGEGAHARVYAVDIDGPMAAKIYLRDVPVDIEDVVDYAREHLTKQIVKMAIPNKPSSGFPLAAGPTNILYEPTTGSPAGVLMKRIPGSFQLLDQHVRSATSRKLSSSATVATNLAKAVHRIHLSSYVMGDESANNFMVDNLGNVAAIDVDSFGFPRRAGKPRMPMASTRHYMAPDGLLDEGSDDFALNCLVLQVLLGLHPFGGRRHGSHAESNQENIDAGQSWIADPAPFNLPKYMRGHPGVEILPTGLRDLATSLLNGRPWPTAEAWESELKSARPDVTQCACGDFKFGAEACPGEKHRARFAVPSHGSNRVPDEARIRPRSTPRATQISTPAPGPGQVGVKAFDLGPTIPQSKLTVPTALAGPQQAARVTRQAPKSPVAPTLVPSAARPQPAMADLTVVAKGACAASILAMLVLAAYGAASSFNTLGLLWWLMLAISGVVMVWGVQNAGSSGV